MADQRIMETGMPDHESKVAENLAAKEIQEKNTDKMKRKADNPEKRAPEQRAKILWFSANGQACVSLNGRQILRVRAPKGAKVGDMITLK